MCGPSLSACYNGRILALWLLSSSLTKRGGVEYFIMELEKQVVSLELAKRLKELGVRQESFLTWLWRENEVGWFVGDRIDIGNNNDAIARRLNPWYEVGPSAFTVAELGEMLPLKIRSWQDSKGVWICEAEGSGFFHEDTEADARARMLIYLIENSLISQS